VAAQAAALVPGLDHEVLARLVQVHDDELGDVEPEAMRLCTVGADVDRPAGQLRVARPARVGVG
jgi:hypothetical protein